ncbi:hypothetical protein [Granulicella sibirica]|uniref:Uncharacterized protein n=1 Tax=Granulicella sibirica TaxID=2479048 RepID=A0A4Q0T355_9BACT|nr:hypothetical protein [Granulicella sibirica]RXH57332.1 hypothetical protein GRAN_0642 [Granulicella sibirica]
MSELTEPQVFHIEEYKALRKEIEIHLTESRTEERYLVIAVGAIWAWLITNHNHHVLLWCIPLLLAVASVSRMAALTYDIIKLGSYLRGVENHFHAAGWEHHLLNIQRFECADRSPFERFAHAKRKINIGRMNNYISVAILILALIGLIDHDDLAGGTYPCSISPVAAQASRPAEPSLH